MAKSMYPSFPWNAKTKETSLLEKRVEELSKSLERLEKTVQELNIELKKLKTEVICHTLTE